MKSSNFFALLLLMAAVMWAPCIYAQSDRGTITGTVVDQSGGVVPNAKVTATNIDSGEKRETTTGDESSFTLPELKAAPYRISVEAAGFKTATIDNVQLGVQITRRAEITLEAGDISENVTVSAEAAFKPNLALPAPIAWRQKLKILTPVEQYCYKRRHFS